MLKFYQYVYYAIYKIMEPMGFWAETRAYFLLLVFNAFSFSLIIALYEISFHTHILFFNNNIFNCILSLVVAALNYRLLLHKDKWKKIVKEFDKLSLVKNLIGVTAVWIIIIVIVISCILLISYVSKMDF